MAKRAAGTAGRALACRCTVLATHVARLMTSNGRDDEIRRWFEVHALLRRMSSARAPASSLGVLDADNVIVAINASAETTSREDVVCLQQSVRPVSGALVAWCWINFILFISHAIYAPKCDVPCYFFLIIGLFLQGYLVLLWLFCT